MRKGFFWLLDFQTSVYDHLALLFWACSVVAHCSQAKLTITYLKAAIICFKGMTSVTGEQVPPFQGSGAFSSGMGGHWPSTQGLGGERPSDPNHPIRLVLGTHTRLPLISA